MSWVSIFQILAIVLNLASVFLNIYSTKKSSSKLTDLGSIYTKQINAERKDYQFHINRLIEEINLLKGNEGLYDLRNDTEKYQVYLGLLRKEQHE